MQLLIGSKPTRERDVVVRFALKLQLGRQSSLSTIGIRKELRRVLASNAAIPDKPVGSVCRHAQAVAKRCDRADEAPVQGPERADEDSGGPNQVRHQV